MFSLIVVATAPAPCPSNARQNPNSKSQCRKAVIIQELLRGTESLQELRNCETVTAMEELLLKAFDAASRAGVSGSEYHIDRFQLGHALVVGSNSEPGWYPTHLAYAKKVAARTMSSGTLAPILRCGCTCTCRT